MNLKELLADDKLPGIELKGLSEHTLEVEPEFGFISVAANDEALLAYADAAVERGANAVLCPAERASALADCPVPVVGVDDLDRRRGELAAKFYGDPSRSLACIGVTGTNGKTSVAYHIADLSLRLGMPLGYSGTLGWGGLDALQTDVMTTANAVALQRRLALLKEAGFAGIAMEVSSHALDQRRADAVAFDVGVFTNLSRDHLDYHGTLGAYGAAKARLFEAFPLQAAVINVDDEYGRTLAASARAPVLTYGKDGDWRWQRRLVDGGSEVRWLTPHGEFEATLPVIADYALDNITAAMLALVALDQDAAAVVAALKGLQAVPGRMEMFGASGQPSVVVDYAHTPDALAKVLSALGPVCRGKLVCVVGCGGDRDRGKRPEMGAVAARADEVWLTSDNPRSESPEAIIADMQSGIAAADTSRVTSCVARATAIAGAVQGAVAGDVVLIAGKGHEDYQEIAGQRLPFDDRVEVTRALEGR